VIELQVWNKIFYAESEFSCVDFDTAVYGFVLYSVHAGRSNTLNYGV